MSNRIEQLHKFLEEDSKNVFILYSLGLENISINQLVSAQDYFDKVISLDSDYLAVYYQYAKLLEMMDNRDGAEKMYRKGIEVAQKQDNQFTLRELNSALEELLFA